MADIKLSPEQLLAQSMEMTSLQTEYEALFAQVTNALNGINDSWSENLASNFAGKIQSAQKSFSSIGNMLINGSAAARLSSLTFSSGMGISDILSGLFNESTVGTGLFSDPSELAKMILESGESLDEGSGAWISEMLGMGADVDTVIEAAEMVMNGDYEGALKIAYEKGLDWAASALSGGIPEGSTLETINEMTGGVFDSVLGLADLEKDFYKNLIGGTIENGVAVMQEQDPGKQNQLLGEMAWNLAGGEIIDTAFGKAWDVVEKIPGVGEWYTNRGADDWESAYGAAFGEVVYLMTGSEADAQCVQDYFSTDGSFGRSVVDGIGIIAEDAWNAGSSVVENAWNSIFGK